MIYTGGVNYINNIVYYVILVVMALSGIVYWLLREKKKPTILYLATLIYFTILLFVYAYIFNLLQVLSNEMVEMDRILTARDISLLISLPQYVLFVFCFIRGIGFNIKQFNFSKDIAELQIASQDSAEFELLIGQNNYRYMRTIRRAIRETKYYILENKLAISAISIIILLISGGIGIYYYNQYLKSFKESELISVNSISYVVNKSYLTAYDYNGNLIRDGYKYVVVDMTFYNSSLEDKYLNLDLITLKDGDLIYYPTLTKNSKFYDLGVPYGEKEIIESQEYLSRTLTFEIPSSVKTKNYILRVQYDISSTNSGNVVAQYRNFDVKATPIDTENQIRDYQVQELINSDIVGKNRFSLTISGYEIMDSYDNKFIRCTSVSSCKPISSIISATAHSSEKTMLVIDFKGMMYDEANFTKTFNTYNKIFKNYAAIKYTYYDRDYTEFVDLASNDLVDGKIFALIDRKITNASAITLELYFRNETYRIPLKTSEPLSA